MSRSPKDQGGDGFYREGKNRDHNPFERGTDDHRQWDDGYCAAFLREYGTGMSPYAEFWK